MAILAKSSLRFSSASAFASVVGTGGKDGAPWRGEGDEGEGEEGEGEDGEEEEEEKEEENVCLWVREVEAVVVGGGTLRLVRLTKGEPAEGPMPSPYIPGSPREAAASAAARARMSWSVSDVGGGEGEDEGSAARIACSDTPDLLRFSPTRTSRSGVSFLDFIAIVDSILTNPIRNP